MPARSSPRLAAASMETLKRQPDSRVFPETVTGPVEGSPRGECALTAGVHGGGRGLVPRSSAASVVGALHRRRARAGAGPPAGAGPAGDLLTGPIYIVAGLIAWRRRPENRIGPMMVVLGDTIVLPWAIGAAGTLGFTLASVVDDVSPVIGLLAFLSFPTGRLERRPERIVGRRGRRRVRRADRGRGAVPRPGRGRVRRLPAERRAGAQRRRVADAVVTVVQIVAVLVVCGMVAILATALARGDAARPPRPRARCCGRASWSRCVFALTYALDPLERPWAAEFAGAAVGAIPGGVPGRSAAHAPAPDRRRRSRRRARLARTRRPSCATCSLARSATRRSSCCIWLPEAEPLRRCRRPPGASRPRTLAGDVR